MSTTVELQSPALKSEWGYHPCDKATYLKLKRLHKIYWEQVYKIAAWNRWDNKLNKPGPEPECDQSFDVQNYVCRSVKPNRKTYKKDRDSHPIRIWFLAARTPSPEPVEPFTQSIIDKIDEYVKYVDAKGL